MNTAHILASLAPGDSYSLPPDTTIKKLRNPVTKDFAGYTVKTPRGMAAYENALDVVRALEPRPTLALAMGAPQVNTVHHMKAETLLAALPDDHVDLIVTSPPYDNLRSYKGFAWDFEYIARQSYRVLKPGGVLVWVVGDSVVDGSETLTCFKHAIYFREVAGFNVHDTMIYQRDGLTFPDTLRYNACFEYMFVLSKRKPKSANLIMSRRNKYAGQKISKTQRRADGQLEVGVGQRLNRTHQEMGILSNVWQINSGYMKTTKDKDAYEHPAMFPEELAERHILTWSNPGDVVLDYFGGSGTTAKMARANNRQWITCDISAEYCDLMRRRLAQPYTPNMFAGVA